MEQNGLSDTEGKAVSEAVIEVGAERDSTRRHHLVAARPAFVTSATGARQAEFIELEREKPFRNRERFSTE
jgi:hypothetical protein